jgi:molybdenum cofactor cytidylyltransferase
MIFERVPLARALGGILAHNLKTADRVLRKGALVDAAAFALLQAAGFEAVTIARLEPGDVPEGEAASYLGELLLGPGLRRSPDVHGRVNLIAGLRGLLRLDAARIERLNRIDESITLATLPDRTTVEKDDLVATIKIIPFAVAGPALVEAEALITGGAPALAIKPFRNLSVGLILSRLPQLKDSAIAHTIEATRDRITARGGTLLAPLETLHETPSLTDAIQQLLAAGVDIILISGASAVTDRLDTAPQAIVQAGGHITHFGMPVDPGNLICLGMIGAKPAIVLPGCARSPALNGIDWVLDLLFAGETVGPQEIAGMGVGGLLKEFNSRPVPRDSKEPRGFGAARRALPRIAALVLAAGRSTRMGDANKLLAAMPSGQAMIAQTIDHVTSCFAQPVIVVTGHQDHEIRSALADKPVRFVHAADYAEGMAASLHTGITALSAEIGAVLICLGDMPLVEPAMLNRIIAAYDPAEGREIIIPSFQGQRGNPVLWGKRFFPELLKLSGDTGGRQILHRYPERVAEVQVETDSVLRDFDTPEMLAALAK